MADHHRAEPIADAAVGRGALKEGYITHSESGAKYSSHECPTLARKLKLGQNSLPLRYHCSRKLPLDC